MTLPYPEGESDYKIKCSDSKLSSYEYIYENRTYDEFSAYIADLEAVGMTRTYENSFENAVHAYTYYGFSKTVYTYYVAADKTIKVIVTEGEEANAATQSSYTSKGVAPKVAQLGTESTNGMGYIFTLDDGSFLVYDGGEGAYAEALYDYMYEASESDDFVIAGWVITHAHADHYGAFRSFITRYPTVEIEKIFYNAGAIEYLDGLYNEATGGNLSEHSILKKDLYGLMGHRSELIRVHTGQTIALRNAEIDILYTPEDYYSYVDDASKIEANDLSVVSTVSLENKKMLITGDLTYYGIEVLATYYGGTEEILNCNIVQSPHHGSPSDFMMHKYADTLVNLMTPDTVFCPTTQSGGSYDNSNRFNSLLSSKTRYYQDTTAIIDLNS